MKKLKIAVCSTEVPSILSPTGEAIEAGTKVEYKRIYFRNGEHHYELANGTSVPSVFFEDAK